MTETDDIVARLRERLGGIQIDAMQGDNLAITLCTSFDDPDEEIEPETCWGQSALNGANATLDAIHAHYAAHITRLEERCAALAGKVAAGAAEIERSKIEAGTLRMCLNCGRTADAATFKRGDDLPECRGPDGLSGCAFDATPQEAWEFWRQKAHDYMTRAEAAERENAALKEEVGRLRAALQWVDDMRRKGCPIDISNRARAALQPQEPKPNNGGNDE